MICFDTEADVSDDSSLYQRQICHAIGFIPETDMSCYRFYTRDRYAML